eukprot:COSAG01_NODE_52807_length_344_cov_0.559184_1_plen_82_part_10
MDGSLNEVVMLCQNCVLYNRFFEQEMQVLDAVSHPPATATRATINPATPATINPATPATITPPPLPPPPPPATITPPCPLPP